METLYFVELLEIDLSVTCYVCQVLTIPEDAFTELYCLHTFYSFVIDVSRCYLDLVFRYHLSVSLLVLNWYAMSMSNISAWLIYIFPSCST